MAFFISAVEQILVQQRRTHAVLGSVFIGSKTSILEIYHFTGKQLVALTHSSLRDRVAVAKFKGKGKKEEKIT